jgi:hypothetical protein
VRSDVEHLKKNSTAAQGRFVSVALYGVLGASRAYPRPENIAFIHP